MEQDAVFLVVGGLASLIDLGHGHQRVAAPAHGDTEHHGAGVVSAVEGAAFQLGHLVLIGTGGREDECLRECGGGHITVGTGAVRRIDERFQCGGIAGHRGFFAGGQADGELLVGDGIARALDVDRQVFQLHTLLCFRKGRGQAQAQAKHQRQQRRREFSDLHFIPSFTAPALSSTPEEWFLHR